MQQQSPKPLGRTNSWKPEGPLNKKIFLKVSEEFDVGAVIGLVNHCNGSVFGPVVPLCPHLQDPRYIFWAGPVFLLLFWHTLLELICFDHISGQTNDVIHKIVCAPGRKAGVKIILGIAGSKDRFLKIADRPPSALQWGGRSGVICYSKTVITVELIGRSSLWDILTPMLWAALYPSPKLKLFSQGSLFNLAFPKKTSRPAALRNFVAKWAAAL